VPPQTFRRPPEPSSFEPEVQEASIRRLLDLVADGAPPVAAHMERTARLARALVRDLDLAEPLARIVVITARLHDVGKLGIPPWVLEKPAPLSEFESRLMREHSLIGQEMLERRMELLAIGPLGRATHECWDGTGYPDGLRGDEIPLGARIVAVCDAFDAMTTERPYREPVSEADAMAELRRCAGTQFDPMVVEAFCRVLTREHPALGEVFL
jgi:HD-GYP domain-containing protein (c-di-GMP phosphodiesterase class II)